MVSLILKSHSEGLISTSKAAELLNQDMSPFFTRLKVNLTQDNPQQYVIDTNTLIDLHCGQLFPFIFQLSCVFIVSDFIVYELRYLPFQTLLTMGLVVESLSSEEIVEISSMMGRYEKPSYADLSV